MHHKYTVFDLPTSKKITHFDNFSFIGTQTVYLKGMDITADQVKHWLSQHPERDRYWLAEKCGAEKGTVDNWLSTSRGIPNKALRFIENLMRADAENQSASQPALQNVVIRVGVDEFEDWSRAGLAHGQIVTEYCLAAIRSAYKAESGNSRDGQDGNQKNGTDG